MASFVLNYLHKGNPFFLAKKWFSFILDDAD